MEVKQTHITIEKDKIEQVIQWAEKHGEIVFAGGGMEAVDSMNVLVESLRRSVAKAEKQEPVACWCHKCNEGRKVNGLPFSMTRMILCPDCGNKRCPKASNHTFQCTNSNEPNQAGSVYAHPQPKREPLTDEQILSFVNAAPALDTAEAEWLHVARAIEAAHGIKENA
jgi:hypothetical protein